MFSQKWHDRFMHLAEIVSTYSKDPSTQVGALIVNTERHPISMGYNGLPADMEDDEELLNDREEKYKYIIHAERNAIDNSVGSLYNSVLYVTHPCCEICAQYICDNGIKTIVWKGDEAFSERWNTDAAVAIFHKYDVNIIIL